MTNTFAALGLPEALTAAVADMGYETPTPIQTQSIPELLKGRDMLAAAQTGTGQDRRLCAADSGADARAPGKTDT